MLPMQASAQSFAPDGFRFHRDKKERVVAVEYYGKAGLRSSQISKLPDLESMMIVYGTELTADDIDYLSTLTDLVDLMIGQETIDMPVDIKGDLSKLKQLTLLESVHLCKHDIRDVDLKFIGSLPRITFLEFNADANLNGKHYAVTDLCGDYLCSATTLEEIWIQGHGNLTDEFVSKLTNGLPNLESFRLACPELTDESLRLLAKRSKRLKLLDVRSNKFTDAGIEHLSKASKLETLLLDSSSLTEECVKSIGGLHQLQCLQLTIPTISDAGARMLAKLPSLEILAMRQPALTDAQFATFRNHQTLKSAFINGKTLSNDQILEIIETIPNLEHITISSKNTEFKKFVDRMLNDKKRPKH